MMEYAYIFLMGLVSTFVLGKITIPMLERLKAKQSIREDGPQNHMSKAGTPTMGGLFLLAGLTLTVLIASPYSLTMWMLLFLTLGHGLLGFSDDFIKSLKRRNLGLTARQKIIGQLAMSSVFCYLAIEYAALPTTLWIPFTDVVIDIGMWYYALVFAIIVGTTNAVNLTDGLDGLASGTAAIAAAAYAVVGMMENSPPVTIFSIALCGAALSFLCFNYHPAKVFMGDTGSLALGGAFAGMAIMTKTELLLVIIGGIFVMEALSVIIQVLSFKTRGVRVFKMSPIHHHFELSGWNEIKVVTRFWLGGLVLALIGLATIAV